MDGKVNSFIVRDRFDPSKQMHITVNHETQKVGVVYNNGLDMLIIETGLHQDMAITAKDTP